MSTSSKSKNSDVESVSTDDSSKLIDEDCCKTYEDFSGTIQSTLNFILAFENDGFNTVGFRIDVPSESKVEIAFQGTFDNVHWTPLRLKNNQQGVNVQTVSSDGEFRGSILCLKGFRFVVTSTNGNSVNGSVTGRISKGCSCDASVSDYFTDVSAGNITGVRSKNITMFGSATANNRILTGSKDSYYPSQSGGLISVMSSSVNDTVLGTGARTLKITGLDGNWNEYSEVVGLQGTTPVVTTLAFMRVFEAVVMTSGTYGVANEGIISLYDTFSVEYTRILPNDGRGTLGIWTVPANKTAHLVSVNTYILPHKLGSLDVILQENSTNTSRVVLHRFGAGAESAHVTFDTRIKLLEKTDLFFTGKVNSGVLDVSLQVALLIYDM